MRRNISIKDLSRYQNERATTLTKLNDRFIEKISKDRNVFGNVIKGIDLGRMSDEEYDKFIEQNQKESRGWSI